MTASSIKPGADARRSPAPGNRTEAPRRDHRTRSAPGIAPDQGPSRMTAMRRITP